MVGWFVAIWRWLVGLLVAIWLVCWCSRDLQADLIGATAAAGGRGGGDLIRALEGGKEGEKEKKEEITQVEDCGEGREGR